MLHTERELPRDSSSIREKNSYQRLAVFSFKFVELRSVDDTCDDFANVESFFEILADDAVQISDAESRFFDFANRHAWLLFPVEYISNGSSESWII